MPEQGRDVTIAKLYNEKVTRLAKAAAERQGPPYNTESTPYASIIQAWNTPNPDVSEEEAWQQVMQQAAEALNEDPELNRDEVIAEIPVRVADLVYPHRRKIVLSFGGVTDREHAERAEWIEERAAKLREERNAEPAETVPMSLPPVGEPETPPAVPPMQPAIPEPPATAPAIPVTPMPTTGGY